MIQLNKDNFEKEVLKNDKPVLVDFWAEWCGPCKIMLPVIEELVKEYEGKPVKIGKLNVDENQKMASKYSVMSIPAFILFKEGKIISQSAGAQSKEKLKELINQSL